MKKGVDFGYNIKDGKVTVNQVESEIIKSIFKMFKDGVEISKISNHFMKKSYIDNINKKLCYEKVNRILRNSDYTGSELYMQIISSEEFGEVELLLRKYDKNVLEKKLKSNTSELIEGKIVCYECGAKYNAYNIADQSKVKLMKCSRYRVKRKRECKSAVIHDNKIIQATKCLIKELSEGKRETSFQKSRKYINLDQINKLNAVIMKKEEDLDVDDYYIELVYKKAQLVHKCAVVYDESYNLKMQKELMQYSGELDKAIVDALIKELVVISDSELQFELLNGRKERVSI